MPTQLSQKRIVPTLHVSKIQFSIIYVTLQQYVLYHTILLVSLTVYFQIYDPCFVQLTHTIVSLLDFKKMQDICTHNEVMHWLWKRI